MPAPRFPHTIRNNLLPPFPFIERSQGQKNLILYNIKYNIPLCNIYVITERWQADMSTSACGKLPVWLKKGEIKKGKGIKITCEWLHSHFRDALLFLDGQQDAWSRIKRSDLNCAHHVWSFCLKISGFYAFLWNNDTYSPALILYSSVRSQVNEITRCYKLQEWTYSTCHLASMNQLLSRAGLVVRDYGKCQSAKMLCVLNHIVRSHFVLSAWKG